MKFSTITLAAFAGSALAAPYAQVGAEPKPSMSKGRIAIFKVVAAGIVSNLLAKTIGTRVLNDIYGIQQKRDVLSTGATFDNVREAFIARYTQELLEENPHADAAVCTGVGYSVSAPNATLWAASFELQVAGQSHEYDCFMLEGPVTVDVGNATSTDFAYAAPGSSTYENGVLTIS